jgi:DNA-binding CsgD family transcriptional regulator
MALSQREKEILKLIISEYSSAAIAERLEISIRTVDTHRKNITKKLQTKSLIGLTKYAIKEGMLKGYSWKQNNP